MAAKVLGYTGRQRRDAQPCKRRKKPKEQGKTIWTLHSEITTLLSTPTIYSEPERYLCAHKGLARLSYLSRHSFSQTDRALSKRELKQCRDEIRDAEQGFALGWYLLKVHTLIKPSTTTCLFVSAPSIDKSLVMQQYLSIACEFVDCSIELPRRLVCMCGAEYAVEQHALHCNSCGHEKPHTSKSKTRSTTQQEQHFLDTVRCFQGKQNTVIKPEVYETVRQEMAWNGLSIHNLKKLHIYNFLSDNGYNNYEDIHLIYSQITGKPCKDLSLYEKELIEYHTAWERSYDRIRGKYSSRMSSLNVTFKLYALLWLLRYPIDPEDFFLLKSGGKLDEHKEIFHQICQMNGPRWQIRGELRL